MVESKGERRTDVDVQIIDLLPENEDAVRQAATLLFEVFKEHHPNAWPTMEAAMEEVKETFGENRISRVAVNSDGLVRAGLEESEPSAPRSTHGSCILWLCARSGRGGGWEASW